MDITYNILKNYESEVLPLLKEQNIETFVQTVLDLAQVQYTFTLMKNLTQFVRRFLYLVLLVTVVPQFHNSLGYYMLYP